MIIVTGLGIGMKMIIKCRILSFDTLMMILLLLMMEMILLPLGIMIKMYVMLTVIVMTIVMKIMLMVDSARRIQLSIDPAVLSRVSPV